MYRDGYEAEPAEYNVVFDQGGLGDHVAALPAVKYLCQNHKQVKVNLWVPNFFKEYAANCLRDCDLKVWRWDEMKGNFKEIYARAFGVHRMTNLASNMTNHAFKVILNCEVGNEHKNYVTPDISSTDVSRFDLPDNYVVMTIGYTADAREFYPEYVNEVVSKVKALGYNVVFLGKKSIETGNGHTIKGQFSDQIDFTDGLNLIDQTDLFEASKIMDGSRCVFGLDNGLIHLAAASGDVPIVAGYSTVRPMHRVPVRHDILGWNVYTVTPPESLKCRFCQSNMTFTMKHNFTQCVYGEDDYSCLKQMTPDLWMNAFEWAMEDNET